MKRIDIQNQRFGRLTVLSYEGDCKWKCLCDCGRIICTTGTNLRKGTTSSCGCFKIELLRKRSTTHGRSKTRLYAVWNMMKDRCLNPSSKAYKYYGGRGIAICEDWLTFENFLEWANASGYDETAQTRECTIDRVNNDGDYSPENCRWVSMAEQSKNMRHSIKPTRVRPVDLIDDDGNVIAHYASMADASRDTGCRVQSIYSVCRGQYKSSLGKRWKYSEQENK